MKRNLLFIVACIFATIAQAQQNVRAYYTADTLPPMTLHLINSAIEDRGNVLLNRPGKKLTLLDFWGTYCGTCIGSFPKLHRLQTAFADDLQILMVNLEPDSIVHKFFATRSKLNKPPMQLQLVREDTQLEKIFPTTTIPHYVWIDEHGVVRAITKSALVDSTNIAVFLDKGKTPAQQSDYLLPWGWDEPMFTSGMYGNGERTMWHSVISGYVEGLPSHSAIAADSTTGYGILMLNVSLPALYQMAYGDSNTDEHLFVDDATKDSLYCYQLLTPPLTVAQLKKYMQQDLYRQFGITIDQSCRSRATIRNLVPDNAKR